MQDTGNASPDAGQTVDAGPFDGGLCDPSVVRAPVAGDLIINVPSGWSVVGFADMDGDGDADCIIEQNAALLRPTS